jgi:predicted nucleic acid-binding protein
MPILDTVVLFGAADPMDRFHKSAVSFLSKLGSSFLLGTFAIMEFDVVLKSSGLSNTKRMEEMTLLTRDFPNIGRSIHRVSPTTFYLAALFEEEFRLDYFDALIAAEATEHDGIVVSSDRELDRIPNLRRIRLDA